MKETLENGKTKLTTYLNAKHRIVEEFCPRASWAGPPIDPEWIPLPNHPNYEINVKGEVREREMTKEDLVKFTVRGYRSLSRLPKNHKDLKKLKKVLEKLIPDDNGKD